jgi:flagellar biosynthesis protein FlhG
VVTGGKGGVGISTLVVNLAAVLARQGKRTLIASAAEEPRDIEMICGVAELNPAAAAGCPRQGPAGILLLPHREHAEIDKRLRARRVFSEIAKMGSLAEVAIVDGGTRFDCSADPSGDATDTLLFVTTGDSVAVMDTYAAIKNCRGDQERQSARIALLVNRTCGGTVAKCTHDRIATTCQRFLATKIQFAGEVPDDASLCAAVAALPAVLQSPTSEAARAIERVAAMLTRGDKE